MAIKREEENKMKKQMTPAEIELARQSFAKLAFGVEYNEGGSLDLLQIARCAAATATRPIK
jgi:hypothetical protein